MSALCKAIEQRRFKQVRFLLELGSDLNSWDESSGKTPLVAASLLEEETLACQLSRCLLKNGADVRGKDRQGMTALMHASRLGRERLVKELLKTGECDLSATDNDGNTTLMHSIMAGNAAVVKTLTDSLNRYQLRGVDIPNNTGETPLIKAAQLGRTKCAHILLTHGKASRNARDLHQRLTAIEWCELTASKKLTGVGSIQPEQLLRASHVRGRRRTGAEAMRIASAMEDNGLQRWGGYRASKRDGNPDVGTKRTNFGKLVNSQPQYRDVRSPGEGGPAEQSNATAPDAKSRSTAGNDSCRGISQEPRARISPPRQRRDRNPKGQHKKEQRATPRNLSTTVGLSNLLDVWEYQNTASFRPSVKHLPPESEVELNVRSSSQKSTRNKIPLERSASPARQRFSKAARAVVAWKKFPSLYSRGDFTVLREETLGGAHARRLSLHTPTNATTNVAASRTARRLSVQDRAGASGRWECRSGKPHGSKNIPQRRHSEVPHVSPNYGNIQFAGRK